MSDSYEWSLFPRTDAGINRIIKEYHSAYMNNGDKQEKQLWIEWTDNVYSVEPASVIAAVYPNHWRLFYGDEEKGYCIE